jgi:hypothetical protein
MKNKSLPQNTCYRAEAEHNEANEHGYLFKKTQNEVLTWQSKD